MPESQLKKSESEMNVVMKCILENVLKNSIRLMDILTFGFAELLHKSESQRHNSVLPTALQSSIAVSSAVQYRLAKLK